MHPYEMLQLLRQQLAQRMPPLARRLSWSMRMGQVQLIDAHNLAATGNPLENLHDLPVEEAPVARRARAGRDGGVERVNVDGDVVADALGY